MDGCTQWLCTSFFNNRNNETNFFSEIAQMKQ